MLLRFLKRAIFVILAMLCVMMWAAPSLAQIIESEGYASWYNQGSQGLVTASGENYDSAAMTAAHPYLSFDSMVRVTRMDTGRSIVVRINDRMAPGPGHIIDLSGAAAARLGLLDVNVARVRLDLEEEADLIRMSQRIASWERETPAPREYGTVPAEPIRAPTAAAHQEDEGRFTLQLGVFSSQPAAVAFASDFKNGWVTQVSESGQTLYRVYHDRYSQEQPARMAQRQLKESGHESFLRSLL